MSTRLHERSHHDTEYHGGRTPPLLTIDDVARILVVSKTTVWRLADAGGLPRVHVGPGGRLVRFREADVEALIRPPQHVEPAGGGLDGTERDDGARPSG